MIRTLTVVCLLSTLAGTATAATADTAKAPEAKAAAARPTVAVLDYQLAVPGNTKLGSQIADILTARLSVADAFDLVERAKLGKIIEEQKLKLIGIVDQAQAVKVGKLLGAKLLVMGKGFVMDKKLMIVTKVVGVETGLVKGTIRTVELSKPISEAIMLLGGDVAGVIKKNAARLLPAGSRLADPVAAFNKKLGKWPRPTVAVIVTEEHRRRREPAPVVDPAVETEIKRTLIAAGFTVVDTGKNDLADWARNLLKGKSAPWPAAIGKADYVVVGEAFSEFALRTGDLLTCAARAEINVIERKTGRIVVAERRTDRAVDLAENLAGKTALQKAGRTLAVGILNHFAAAAPAKPADAAGGKEKK